ncbi:MAG TPA: peptidoglycan DD-metalloendopeptidase family protein [Xanthobacteraceae bacterium]|nr:peptidoglycan DD-metalloendopeptidase family protein [Xanthobacteraceae bacterium]
MLALLVPAQVFAQSAPPTAKELEKAEREKELEILRSDLEQRKATETKIRTEVEALKDDRKKFGQALIDTAARLKAIEGRLSAAEARLKPLDGREADIKRSLDSRQTILAEVLSAAARLSRRPAPAIMLKPEDALDSVRSAMLLGAVVPELRQEAETLIADLAELGRVRKEIETERQTLADNRSALAEDRVRLAALIEERQRRQSEREKALEGERGRAQALAKQVQTVTELVVRIEKDIEAARRAAEEAERKALAEAARREAEAVKLAAEAEAARRKAEAESAKRQAAAEAAKLRAEAEAASREAEAAQREAAAAKQKAEKRNFAALADPARITPALSFADAKGQFALPVAGTRIRDFGAPDGAGGTEKGIQVSTRPGTQVTAPCDGWVVYAGLFRSYGRLLIINGGGGYHVLLAGMEQITVELGQFVLAGEPVAVMAGGGQGAAAKAAGAAPPILYIEFRKDGNSIDPAPWWAETENEKARG